MCMPPVPYALNDPVTGLMLYCCHLKFLTIFEQGALLFHFALDPTNYVARPAFRDGVS